VTQPLVTEDVGARSTATGATDADSIDVVLNARAGTASDPQRAQRIVKAFARQGLRARLHGGDGAQALEAVLDALCARAPERIVAAGGDGTLNAVAARLVDSGTTMGILPLGTLNHFARDLGLPLELDAAVAVIACGHRRSVDVGEVNGEVFLNNASLGLYATMVAHRDHARRHMSLGKWPAMARATWAALRHPRSFDAIVEVDGTQRHWRTPFLFVGNNAYTVQGPALGQRPRLDAGALSLYVLQPRDRWGLIWFGLRALLGRLSGPRDLEVLHARSLHVHGDTGPVRVARDGEVGELAMPLQFRSRPGALRVFVPDGDGDGD
jgi:diacylglycerol kinase family enzyme